ncbi:MAG: hypothetical protein ACT4PL_00720, partial [Phycisphaerales bacterium]
MRALYSYNPWCQLVQVKNRTTPYAVQANFRYDGMSRRITEQLDTSASGNTGLPDGVVDSNDPVFALMLDRQGRRIGTARGTDSWLKETFIHHAPGVTGPGFLGGVLCRDRDADLTDPAKWASTAAP